MIQFVQCPDECHTPLVRIVTMKRCADCRQYKPLDEFPRNKNSKDGRHCRTASACTQRA